MSDPDPPDKIDDRETPAYRDIDAPDTGPCKDQISDGIEKQHHQREREPETGPPPRRGAFCQDDRADLVRDGREGVAGFNDRSPDVRHRSVRPRIPSLPVWPPSAFHFLVYLEGHRDTDQKAEGGRQ